ncbi:MAG: phosphoglucosamine mutase [Hadesarchaea archaeon]|nr:phosphoglucosamine mutase [Hadesarchaea archaeon]
MRKKKLFGTCGIRGPVDEAVTPELIYDLGLGLSTYIGSGEVVLARDPRLTGEMLKHAATAGLLAGGCDVIDIGLAPTPCLSFTTRDLDADAGIMITASHNPPMDNGIKFHNPDGMEYLPDQELDLEEIYFEKRYRKAHWNGVGSVEEYDNAIPKYLSAVIDSVNVEPGIKVVVDCASGAASLATPYLLRELGCEVITLNSNPDGHFPAHSPEPQPWHLEDLRQAVVDLDADVGFAHDGDGDRVVAIDERGVFLKHDTFIASFAKRAAKHHRGGTIVTSVNTSVSIEEVVKEAGGEIARTSLGNLPAAHLGHNAVYAGEPGKSIFPDFSRWMDGIYTAAKFLEIMSSENKKPSQITSEVPSYPMHRENFACPNKYKVDFMRKMRSHLEENITQIRNITDIDGFRINRENGSWVLIRTSGTEPKARMTIEGRTEEEAEELYKTVKKGVKKFLG